MKALHRDDLWCWSVFDAERNVDFHSLAWIRPDGNVLVDPLPMTEHDRRHLDSLGGAAWIVVTNSDHVRATADLAAELGAKVAGPAGERDRFPIACDRWLEEGEALVPGLVAVTLHGSKTPGELALVLEESTLVTGDLVRAHRAGRLMILPEPKLSDPAAAAASVRHLAELPGIETVLVGDGWHVFSGGGEKLRELAGRLAERP